MNYRSEHSKRGLWMQGMGQYAFSPDFQLDVPASTFAGTYTATITVDIVSSPS